jgi:hypothetical protein
VTSLIPIVLSIASIILGIATGVLTWYVSRLSSEKRLRIFVFHAAPALSIDSSIQTNLKAYYGQTEVASVFRVKFQVKNTGFPSISDIKKPLSFSTQPSPPLLDISVIRSEPPLIISSKTERLKDSSTRTEFEFDQLNKGEFFLLECRFDGEIDPIEQPFEITSPGLPRVIYPEYKQEKLALIGIYGLRLLGICSLPFLIYTVFFNTFSILGLPNWVVTLLVAVGSLIAAALIDNKRISRSRPPADL